MFDDVFEVMLAREHLKDFPVYRLADRLSFRLYKPGDANTWVRIHLEAEPYHKVDISLFENEFGLDHGILSRRQFYVCTAEGHEVGTATAWFNNDLMAENYGRIHWVAVSPDYQGKGIAKALTSRLCERFIELGHTKALVTTENFRLNAIHIYRKFGFEPVYRTPKEEAFWKDYYQKFES
jgi:ribosomal protein S18 acetylase RimI-like enzyme